MTMSRTPAVRSEFDPGELTHELASIIRNNTVNVLLSYNRKTVMTEL